jgi:hypothetical protein
MLTNLTGYRMSLLARRRMLSVIAPEFQGDASIV